MKSDSGRFRRDPFEKELKALPKGHEERDFSADVLWETRRFEKAQKFSKKQQGRLRDKRRRGE